jgi:signal transduction histidine kinase/FixJ family two-component response regulator
MAMAERILVIDDTQSTRELFRTILTEAGYDVLSAANGDEGLLLAHDLQPDLIIVDQVMPGRTGLEVVRQLRAVQADMPIIFVTGEGSEQLAVQAIRAGVQDYLIKPVRVDELLASTQRNLNVYWRAKIAERLPDRLMEANQKLEQRFRELNGLVNIGTSVTSLLDLQAILNNVVEAAVSILRAETGNLLLLDDHTGELYMRAASNIDTRTVSTIRIRVSDSLLGQVMRSGQPLIINENEALKIKTAYFIKSAVYVPLRAKGKVIGILSVDHRERSREFDSMDSLILSVLADFAAVAIENTRLYAQTSLERDTLDAVLRDTEDNIIVVNADEQVIFCNPTACRTLEITRTDFMGKPLREVIPHQEVVALFSKQAASGRGRRSEIIINTSGVGDKILNAQLTILQGVGRAVVMQDITHLKKLDRAKSDFVATVAHDLRSPLTAILGYAELLQRSGKVPKPQAPFVQHIISSVHSISLLITELLDLSKIENDFNIDLEPVSLTSVIEESLRALEHHLSVRQHRLERHLDAQIPPIAGNVVRLRQLCTNLIGNAIKYTPPRGQIGVSVWADPDHVFFQVSDNGIGIASEDQPYIFDKFFRTEKAAIEYEGTGLGLAIVKSIVDQHEGRIWLQSKPNEGTIFTVVFARQKASPKVDTQSLEPAPLSK